MPLPTPHLRFLHGGWRQREGWCGWLGHTPQLGGSEGRGAAGLTTPPSPRRSAVGGLRGGDKCGHTHNWFFLGRWRVLKPLSLKAGELSLLSAVGSVSALYPNEGLRASTRPFRVSVHQSGNWL